MDARAIFSQLATFLKGCSISGQMSCIEKVPYRPIRIIYSCIHRSFRNNMSILCTFFFFFFNCIWMVYINDLNMFWLEGY